MAAFTEGFKDTTGGDGHLGSMISKAIAARRFAEDERKLAEEKAKKAGYDSLEEIGVEKGYFFKAALKSKFGGSYLSGKRQDIKAAVDRVKLLKNPKAQFWNFVDNRDSEGKEVKKLNEVERFRKQFDNYNFQSAKRPPEKEVKAETEVVPKKISPFQLEQSRKAKTEEYMLAKTEAKTAKAASSGGGSRVSREDILTAVTAIASSLEKTAQSINNTIGETKVIADGVQAIKTDVVTQLSERTDSIESKLDAIVAAINAQTDLQKKVADDAKTTKAMDTQAGVGNTAALETADDLTTDVDEGTDSGDELDDGMQPSPAATSAQDIEFQQQQMYQEREAGGIVSGPDEGYLAKLHGDEMVIPLDNNFTQGQPSAMDGKVRPKPETKPFSKRSYETGTPKQPSALGSKVGFTSLDLTSMGSKSDSPTDAMTQPLMDAMSLPMMVAGGSVLSAVTQLVNELGPENADAAKEIQKIARPIADVFGLPSNLVNKATGGAVEGKEETEEKTEEKKDKKKGFFGDMMDKLKSMFSGSPRGGGGGGGPSGGPAARPSGGGMTGTQDQRDYAGDIYEMAVAAGAKHPEVAAAIASLETGWGDKERGNNPFNMRGLDGNFLEFASREDAVKEFVRLWDKNHSGYMNLEAYDDPNEAFAAIVDAYAPASDGNNPEKYKQFVANFIEGRMYLKKPPAKVEDSKAPVVPPVNDSQQITENYGLNPGQSMDFSIPGKGNFKAVRREPSGFDIYKYGGIGALVGRHQKIDTTGGQNSHVVEALIKAGKERVAGQQSLNPPATSTPEQIEQRQQAMRAPNRAERRSRSTSDVQIAALNSGGRSTATLPAPDSQQQVVPEGDDNSLTDAFNSTPVTAS